MTLLQSLHRSGRKRPCLGEFDCTFRDLGGRRRRGHGKGTGCQESRESGEGENACEGLHCELLNLKISEKTVWSTRSVGLNVKFRETEAGSRCEGEAVNEDGVRCAVRCVGSLIYRTAREN